LVLFRDQRAGAHRVGARLKRPMTGDDGKPLSSQVDGDLASRSSQRVADTDQAAPDMDRPLCPRWFVGGHVPTPFPWAESVLRWLRDLSTRKRSAPYSPQSEHGALHAFVTSLSPLALVFASLPPVVRQIVPESPVVSEIANFEISTPSWTWGKMPSEPIFPGHVCQTRPMAKHRRTSEPKPHYLPHHYSFNWVTPSEENQGRLRPTGWTAKRCAPSSIPVTTGCYS
jgi:hypothetical protein